MGLVTYVKAKGSLEGAPKGMHAIIGVDPEKGLCLGVIFVLRNTDNGVNVNQQNRLHPYFSHLYRHQWRGGVQPCGGQKDTRSPSVSL